MLIGFDIDSYAKDMRIKEKVRVVSIVRILGIIAGLAIMTSSYYRILGILIGACIVLITTAIILKIQIGLAEQRANVIEYENKRLIWYDNHYKINGLKSKSHIQITKVYNFKSFKDYWVVEADWQSMHYFSGSAPFINKQRDNLVIPKYYKGADMILKKMMSEQDK